MILFAEEEKDQLMFDGVKINYPTAEELRDKGMGKVEEHSEELDHNWIHWAIEWVRDYCKTHPEPFIVHDVQRFAEERGFKRPVSPKAWGPVIVKAKKAGIVKSAGLTYSNNPSQHKCPIGLWVRA